MTFPSLHLTLRSATCHLFVRIAIVLTLLALGTSVEGAAYSHSDAIPQDDTDIQSEIARDENGRKQIQVSGLSRSDVVETADSLRVWILGVDRDTTPPLAGKVIWQDNDLVFQPRFSLFDGQDYFVKLKTASGATQDFVIRAVKTDKLKTRIESAFPSADSLPANTLRFYLHFSTPMQQGDIYRHIQIREVDGQSIELPFLEIEQELWSRDSKRLTLLLDPGRIKRGLKPREEMGPIFVPGKRYQLIVDRKWPAANGQPLAEEFIKEISIIEEDHVQPNPKLWKLTVPESNTNHPLIFRFGESLDHAMLNRVIEVYVHPDLPPLDGKIEITENEKVWSFTPAQPWAPGKYSLRVDNLIEDVAGNSIEKMFDVDVFEKTEPPTLGTFTEFEFQIR